MTYFEDSDYSKLPDGMALLNPKNHSELYLNAILYVLEDPLLDRNAFEAMLAKDNGQLAELLSSAVNDLEVLSNNKSRLFDQNDKANQPVVLATTRSDVSSKVVWYSSVIAGCFAVALIGWQFIFFKPQPSPTIATNTNQSPAFVTDFSLDPFDALDVSAQTSMLQAWTEFRGVEERNVSTSSDALVDGPDCILCSHRDATAERELPDWLVHGASALALDAIESNVN